MVLLKSLFPGTELSAQVKLDEHTIDYNVHGLGCIAGCDIDNDGDTDLLGAGLQDNQIILYRNNGGDPIGWSKIVIGQGVLGAHSVQGADIDGDSLNDVIGAAYSGTPGIPWWRNEEGDPADWPKLAVAPNFINAHEIYACDLDDDGDIDILGASSDLNKIAWWRNDGGDPLHWTEQTLTTEAGLAKSVHAADFDGNDTLDIVSASIADNKIRWWKNRGGDPIEWEEYMVSSFYGAHRVEGADIDGDGDKDILGAAYLGHQVAWWENEGGDTISWRYRSIGTGFTNACVATAVDMDGDTDLDVVATAQGINTIAWWRNDGGYPVKWTKFTIADDFIRPWPLLSCDLDGDGDNDVVVGSSHNGNNKIKWWENKGLVSSLEDMNIPGNFSLEQNYPNPFNPETVITFKLAATEKAKLYVSNILGEKVSVLVDENLPAGEYRRSFDGNGLSAGIYFCTLETEHFTKTIKMALTK